MILQVPEREFQTTLAIRYNRVLLVRLLHIGIHFLYKEHSANLQRLATAIMGVCGAVLIVIATIFFPPLGVWAVAGCGMDIFINICLTILGYFPGHIHAFYLEYVYYDRKQQAREGHYPPRRAPGIYSDKVQTGGQGRRQGYGTMAPAPGAPIGGPAYDSQGYGNQGYANQGYVNQGYGNQGQGNQGYA